MHSHIIPFVSRTVRILLVCGSRGASDSLADALRRRSVSVCVATDPLIAIERVHIEVPDAIWIIDDDEVPVGDWLYRVLTITEATPMELRVFWVNRMFSDGRTSARYPYLAGSFPEIPAIDDVVMWSRGTGVAEGSGIFAVLPID